MDAGLALGPGTDCGQAGDAPGDGLALYVHIPFCETKCHYCDFNTYAGIDALIPGYLDALKVEVRAWGQGLGRPRASSVFFGGGTPSYVPVGGIEAICDTIRQHFDVAPGAEVTLESNPGDFSRRDLRRYLGAGFNRLSIGVQSFDDGLLAGLSRRHDSATAVRAYRSAREAGFRNVNLDLMFSLPGQSEAQWRDTLDCALELDPEHLSVYALTLEPGTPLEASVRRGRVEEPDPDLAADMYVHAVRTLATAGYEQYEISNWSKPGRESRHNLAYWRNHQYLGVGPGAHSHLRGRRFATLRSPRRYVELLGGGVRGGEPVETLRAAGVLESVDVVTPRSELADTMMMGLRLVRGVEAGEFRERFGTGLDEVFGPEIEALSRDGLLTADDHGVRLSEKGRLLGNEVFERFVTASAAAVLPGR